MPGATDVLKEIIFCGSSRYVVVVVMQYIHSFLYSEHHLDWETPLVQSLAVRDVLHSMSQVFNN